jgi:N-methylhydantoinase A
MARELDIKTIVVPPYAGNFSAWGLLGSDLVRSASRTQLFSLSPAGLEAINATVAEMFAELEARGQDRSFLAHGVHELGLGMRFTGQEHSLTIPVPWKNGSVGLDLQQLDAAFRAAWISSRAGNDGLWCHAEVPRNRCLERRGRR